jgi:uncharacterized protein
MWKAITGRLGFAGGKAGHTAGLQEGYKAHKRKDYATAMKEWKPLAEQGDAAAQHNLAGMHRQGQGVPQDNVEAMKWYRKAAEQGYAPAQLNLGVMYFQGQPVVQDNVIAHMWFTLAVVQGNDAAVKGRDIVIKQMTPTDISRAQPLTQLFATRDFSASSASEQAGKALDALKSRVAKS